MLTKRLDSMLFKRYRKYLNNFTFESDEKIPKLKPKNYQYNWNVQDRNILYSDVFSTLINKNNINKIFFKNDLLIKEIRKYISSKTS